MGRKYANPPLVEAVCEFRFTPDTQWDMTIPGLVYEKLKDEFPRREQRLFQEIELIQGPDGLQRQIRTSERIVFLMEDRKTFVQIGPRLLAINCLAPYPTWAGFKPKIVKAFEALMDTTDVKGLQRVGLRYINLIEIPSSQIKLEDYFQFYLFLGPELPQVMVNFIVGCEFRYAHDRDLCRVQLITTPSGSSERPAFTLDIDYFLAQPKGIKPEEVAEWVEQAHNEIEQIFEGCITDRLRELFQEVK